MDNSLDWILDVVHLLHSSHRQEDRYYRSQKQPDGKTASREGKVDGDEGISSVTTALFLSSSVFIHAACPAIYRFQPIHIFGVYI
jgi:hypothetical protein